MTELCAAQSTRILDDGRLYGKVVPVVIHVLSICPQQVNLLDGFDSMQPTR